MGGILNLLSSIFCFIGKNEKLRVLFRYAVSSQWRLPVTQTAKSAAARPDLAFSVNVYRGIRYLHDERRLGCGTAVDLFSAATTR